MQRRPQSRTTSQMEVPIKPIHQHDIRVFKSGFAYQLDGRCRVYISAEDLEQSPDPGSKSRHRDAVELRCSMLLGVDDEACSDMVELPQWHIS